MSMCMVNQCGSCGDEIEGREFDGGFIDLDDADQCEACKADQIEGDTMDGNIQIEIEAGPDGYFESKPNGAGGGDPGAGGEIVEFRSTDGAVSLRVALRGDDVWATQAQIAELYGAAQQNVSVCLRKALESGEITQDSVHMNLMYTAADGKAYRVKHYNLDAIMAVGYRARSPRAVEFRKWATRVLRGVLGAPAAAPPPPAPAIDQTMVAAIAAAVAAVIPPVLDRAFEAIAARFERERPTKPRTRGVPAPRLPDPDGRPSHYRFALEGITYKAYLDMRERCERIADLESDVDLLRGHSDKERAIRAARSRVKRRLRKALRWPHKRLRELPAARAARAFDLLTTWEDSARRELDMLTAGRRNYQ